MDYDWTDSSQDIYYVKLSAKENKCYEMAIRDLDCPSLYAYGENGYSDYCKAARKHLRRYADLCGLGDESVNRIFEKHFMYRSN